MELVLFSGQPNTGKSHSVHFICTYLLSKGWQKTDIPYNSHVYSSIFVDDFACLLELEERKVLLHTATDDPWNIDALIASIKTHTPDIVITACRDYDDGPRKYLCQQLGLSNGLSIPSNKQINVLEIPLARITRRNSRWKNAHDWYHQNINNLSIRILSGAQFNF